MKRVEIETPHGFYSVWPAALWPLRAGRWLGARRRRLVCRVRGHRWHERRSFLFGESRSCLRCWTREQLGPYPGFEVRVEAGGIVPRFHWTEDER